MLITNKKICIVGGEDVHKRIALSHYLIKAGFNVTIIGTSVQPFPEYIRYVGYNLKRNFSPTADYKTVMWYKRFFKENDFDIIQTFDTKPNFLLPIALLNTKEPIVRTITGLGTIFMSKSFFSYILRSVYALLHYIVKKRVSMTTFQNTEDRDIFLKKKLVTNANHSMIYSSGIELKNYKEIAPRKRNPFTFICVARLVYEKGIIDLLEAARICVDKGHKFKILLVGPLEENSKKLNQTILNSYSGIVDILGSRNDVKDLLLQSDAMVLPTFREGFARVLLEAAAVGLPLISTNVPGVKEFAIHNEVALLVEPKDCKSLAEAMITLATDEQLCNKLAINALKHVKTFSLENISNQYIAIFNQLIEGNKV